VDTAPLTLSVTPEVSAVSLVLDEDALAASVTQLGATSCTVTCGAAAEPTPVTTDGTVLVSFPSLLSSSTCAVSCGEQSAPSEFSVHVGDISTADALDAVSSVDAVVGRIALDEALARRVLSSSAAVITGDVTLRDSDNAANDVFVRFASLRVIGGSLVLDGVDDLPSLQDIDQDEVLDEDGDGVADDFSFPVLSSIIGELSITGNGSLSTISLPSLASIGTSLSITGNGSLSTISLPSLASIGTSLSITGNGSLSTISLTSLRQIGGDAGADDFSIARNAALLSCGAMESLLDSVYGTDPGQSACPAAFEITLEDNVGVPCSFTCD
jgi:hypothetical protein